MTKLRLNCECGHRFVKETITETSFACPNCGRVYDYRYNPISKMYELEEI